MQVEQIVGGINGDTSAQAIQLRMRSIGQGFLGAARIRVWDAAGGNPIVIINFVTGVSNSSVGDRVLIASDTFPNVSVPLLAPDFVMGEGIPEAYLQAGSLTFEDDTGVVYWRVSWGGPAYTGPTGGNLTNDADGEFGPPFGDPLPSCRVQALRFQGSASAPSTTNAANYVLTTGDVILTNNARTSFTISGVAPDCNANGLADSCERIEAGDFDGNGAVNLVDYAALVECLSTPGQSPSVPSPECVALCLRTFDYQDDQDVDLHDYGFFTVDFPRVPVSDLRDPAVPLSMPTSAR